MSGLQLTRSIDALPDTPDGSTTFYTGGTDKIDVTALNADARLELIVGELPLTMSAIRCRTGLHKSITGLSLAYPPRGPEAFRLSNWTAGSVAGVDVEAYGT